MSVVSRLGLGAVAVAGAAALWGPALDGREAALVEEWLVCFDCGTTPDSVLAFAARKPEATVDTLNRALAEGPPPITMSEAEAALGTAFTRDSVYRLRHQLPPQDRQDYVQGGLQRYENGYRARGAVALGWIHTPPALRALDSALTLPLPVSVLDAVHYAIDSLPP